MYTRSLASLSFSTSLGDCVCVCVCVSVCACVCVCVLSFSTSLGDDTCVCTCMCKCVTEGVLDRLLLQRCVRMDACRCVMLIVLMYG
jgi:hypothetical protein